MAAPIAADVLLETLRIDPGGDSPLSAAPAAKHDQRG
jgi:hypothetical protein